MHAIITQRKVTQMKTSNLAWITLAALGAAGSAQAQRRLPGSFDAGSVFQRECAGCTSGRLGAPGNAAMAGELSAVSLLEARILGDTGRRDQHGIVFGRQLYVGLDERLGAWTLARRFSLQYPALSAEADPFTDRIGAGSSNLAAYSAKRFDYTVKYAPRKRKGVIAELAYSYGEMPDNNALNRAYGATFGYVNGPASIRLAHSRKNTSNLALGSLVKIDTRANNSLISANVVLGTITAYAAYGHNRGAGGSPWNADNPYGALARSMPSSKSRDVLVGVSVALGATTLMGSYIRKDDKDIANDDANQLAVGLCYTMSKRTDVFASYAKITNRSGAGYAIGNASGSGNSALNLGLRHSF